MSNLRHSKYLSIFAFWICFFSLGIPYGLQPYEQLTLPNSLFGFGLIVVFAAAFYLAGVARLPGLEALLLPALAVPTVVVVRIVVDIFLVPDSHNLWPFELLISLILGFLVAGPGAVLGSVLSRQMNKKNTTPTDSSNDS